LDEGDPVTDISNQEHAVPSRLGVEARYEDDVFTMELAPRPEVLHHGVVRASVLIFMVDAIAGITLDQDTSVWTLTTDLSFRMDPVPAPALVTATNTVLRQGRRSGTCAVDLTDQDGRLIASGAIGFAKVPRREGDPPKPQVSPQEAARLIRDRERLERPVREEAAIEVVDAAAGIVEVAVTPSLRNPAGTLQGAMVALIAESAAEELASIRLGRPAIVTELDLRYLAQTGNGPVRTSTRVIGNGAGAPIEIELRDVGADRLTTHVYARAVPVP
jgi:acyl-coenzyme A thioesterase PaaI-like protein